jgi:oligopeptide transport system substrate-binding protein
MRKIYFLLLLLIVCSGCEKRRAREEQHLKVNFQEGDLPSLHPHDLVIYLRGLSLAKVLFEPLTRVNYKGEIELAGAKKVELSEDQLRYTFTLRDHCWSDGTPVTAYHYEEAWKSLLSPLSTCSRSELFYCIKNAEEAKKGEMLLESVGIKAADFETLVIDLAYPSPYFLELTSQCIAVPLIDADKKEQTLFNGPFVVQEWKKGNYMLLKPNPYYWDQEHVGLKGIDIFFIEDVNTTFSLFEKGDIDWIGVPLCPLSSELIHHFKEKRALFSQAVGRSFWVFLNTENPALKSAAIRQALSLTLDRFAITNHILIGGEPSIKPLSNQLLAVKPLLALKEDAIEANERFERGLKELGFTKESFPPLEISYSQQANRKTVAEYLQENWHKALGIDVRLKSVEWNVLRSNLEKGLYTISMAYEGAFYRDPLELLERYATLNPSNFSQWQESSFKEKIAEAKYEKDPAQRSILLSEAETILTQEMPFIPICSDRLLFSHPPQLKGYVIDSIGAIDFSRAYFSK